MSGSNSRASPQQKDTEQDILSPQYNNVYKESLQDSFRTHISVKSSNFDTTVAKLGQYLSKSPPMPGVKYQVAEDGP